MAQVPLLPVAPTPIQNPGVPDVGVQPMTPAISRAPVYQAAAGLGKEMTDVGSRLEMHMVMQNKLAAQQKVAAINEAYRSALQNKIEDPDNGIAAKYRGVNAPNAVTAFDALIHGVPAAPGQPAQLPLRAQVLQKLGVDPSEYASMRLERDFDTADSMFRGKLMNHALAEKNAADDAISNARLEAQVKQAGLITPTMTDDPENKGKLIAPIALAEKSARDAVLNDVNEKMKGTPQEVLEQKAQAHVDQIAKVAVDANVGKNWEAAKKVLDASSASPTAKVALQHTINGARTDQYTETLTKAVLNDPAMRTPSGQIDEIAAQKFVNDKIDMQEKSGTPLPPGHADAIAAKLQSAVVIHNKAVAQHQQIVLEKASDDIWNAQKSGMPPQEAYDKFIKQGKFDNAIERGKAENIYTKIYQRDPQALDAVKIGPSQQAALTAIQTSKPFLDKFPYAQDQKEFLNTMKQKIVEQHLPASAINQLFADQIKNTPTGAPRFLGMGKQQLPPYKVDELLQTNRVLVQAVGGLTQAEKLAQALGGTDKLAPDTNESKAIMFLHANHGKISPETIRTMIEKHPDLLK